MEPVYLLCALLLLSSGALSADVSTLGGACTPGTDSCTKNGAVCDKTTNTCACNDGYVQSGSECARTHTMPCGDGMCIDWENTVCDSNKCKCDSTKGLVANSESTACECPSGQQLHTTEKKCLKKIGQTCSAASECYTGLVCTAGKCACDTTNKHYAAGTDGQVTCDCATGYSIEGVTCYKVLDQACTTSSECISDMVCSASSKCACDTAKNYVAGTAGDKVCTCASGYGIKDGTCLKVIGQACSAASECYTGLVCTGTKCACDTTTKHYGTGTDGQVTCTTCAAGYAMTSEVCMKTIGENCGATSECYTGLVCTAGKCACDTTKHYATGTNGASSCSCPIGSTLDGKMCKLNVGQDCTRGGDSTPCVSMATCSKTTDKCACDASRGYAPNGATCACSVSGFTASGSKCMTNLEGYCSSSCVSGAQCFAGNATYDPVCACNGGVNTDNTCSNAVGLFASLSSLMAVLFVTWRLL